MTEATITSVVVACIAALPPTGVAWLAFRQARENSKKSDDITAKVTEVHTLANSNLTAQTDALATANEKIAALEKSVGALIERLAAK